jgi:hypothetical protein
VYLIWTRGWRGALLAVMFLGLWLLPFILALMVWILMALLAA